MSRYTRPYQGAVVMRRIEYRIPETYGNADVRGGRAVLTLHDGAASQGYKTGYERKPTRWLEAECFTAAEKLYRRQCWRYSGKRWERADADWRKLCADLQMEGCTRVAVESVQKMERMADAVTVGGKLRDPRPVPEGGAR